MGNALGLLEGIGKGRIDRIVMGKLGMNIDLLEGIEELVKREKVQTGVILSAVGALKKATFRNLRVLPPDLKVEKHHRLYLDLEQPGPHAAPHAARPAAALGRPAEAAGPRQAPQCGGQGQRRLHARPRTVSLPGHLGPARPGVRRLGIRALPVGHRLDPRLRGRQL